MLGECDLLAIYEEVGVVVVGLFDVLVPGAVDGIVFDEVCGGIDGTQVVDVDDFQGGIVPCVAKDEASDASESVDCYLDHCLFFSVFILYCGML